MPEYLSPGVYIEEVDRGPKPIQGVSTSTAAFIGFTEKIPDTTVRENGRYKVVKAIRKPRLITNWSQFEDEFGSFVEGAYLAYAVYGFFQNGGRRCYVISLQEAPDVPTARRSLLGNQLVIESKKSGLEGTRLRFKLELEGSPNNESPATPTEPQPVEGDTSTKPKENTPRESDSFKVRVQRLDDKGQWTNAETLEDIRFAEATTEGDGIASATKVAYKYDLAPTLIDIVTPSTRPKLSKLKQADLETWQMLDFEEDIPTPDVGKYNRDEGDSSDLGGILESLDDVSIVCVPDLMVSMGEEGPDPTFVRSVQGLMIGHCEKMMDRVAILDPLPNLDPQAVKDWRMRLPDTKGGYAALYYPWLDIVDPRSGQTVTVPPCGHMAGIWARSDNTRGVHKAPANEPVRFTTGLPYEVNKGEQEILNPIGINCIRQFPGRGIRVWGARTISSDPSWRYLNVRRLFNYVEKSIELNTQWVVFEPNNPDLWARVTRDITAFLRTVWLSGALFGLTQDEAFYVRCDAELNPPETRDLGQLIVEIGLAPVKPAEFVIFRISQTGGIGTE